MPAGATVVAVLGAQGHVIISESSSLLCVLWACCYQGRSWLGGCRQQCCTHVLLIGCTGCARVLVQSMVACVLLMHALAAAQTRCAVITEGKGVIVVCKQPAKLFSFIWYSLFVPAGGCGLLCTLVVAGGVPCSFRATAAAAASGAHECRCV